MKSFHRGLFHQKSFYTTSLYVKAACHTMQKSSRLPGPEQI